MLDLSVYFESAIVGALRGLIGLPLEHPFETIKTKLQSKSNSFGLYDTIKHTLKHDGVIKGIYSGFLPNAIRVTIKNVYRWPMMLGFP
jgi:hypothetical protein